MSNFLTAATSTTASSNNSPSRPDAPAAGTAPDAPLTLIACGALGAHIREIATRRGWAVEVACLPSLLHNRPERIRADAQRLARGAQARGRRVALAYADCGTYGALNDLCERFGLVMLRGLHCYDVFAGPERIQALFDAEPGTYVLTDFLVRSFRRSVLAELGLDKRPELWPDYFGHYRRVVWLAQQRNAGLEAEARAVAAMFGLPLTVIDVGVAGLESELERLLRAAPHRAAVTAPPARGDDPTEPPACAAHVTPHAAVMALPARGDDPTEPPACAAHVTPHAAVMDKAERHSCGPAAAS
jgi:Protein of unknown function (DUF1638)